jgi:formylglycine-generating enzyme required for sulfatase activity
MSARFGTPGILCLSAALICAGAPAWTEVQEPADKAGIEWVTLPGGSFMMGAADLPSWALPRHRVTVKTFQIARTVVTFKQYKECVKSGSCTPAHVSDGECYVWDGSKWAKGILPRSFRDDDHPAVCVDWAQAQAFAHWAGGRLPSEAEWEYAARSGGQERRYPWGDQEASCELAVMEQAADGCGRNSTWPVCSKPRGNTEQGLCDMAGNVWEWVQDWYHDSYEGAPQDGSAWESPPGTRRVVRSGGWRNSGAGYLRSAARGSGDPTGAGGGRGFRPVRELPE